MLLVLTRKDFTKRITWTTKILKFKQNQVRRTMTKRKMLSMVKMKIPKIKAKKTLNSITLNLSRAKTD